MTLKYWGFSSLEIETFPIADAVQEVTEIATLHPTHWRLMAAWNYIAKNADPSTWDWSTVDRIIDTIVTNGIEPILIIGQGVPHWVSTPDRATYYGQFCAAVAQRYGTSSGPFGKICTCYEMWNEPNEDVLWGGSVNPANYVASLKAGYQAIKAVSGLSGSNSTVIFGGLQPVPNSTTPWFGQGWITDSMIDFVTRCFAADPTTGDYFDVLALHPYTDENFGKSGTYVPSMTQDYWIQVQLVINFLESQGLTPRIWLTEVGFSTTDVSQALQSTYMQESWALAQTFPQVEMFLIYNARDTGTNTGHANSNYGVLTYTFAQKTIWTWLETLAISVTQPPGVVAEPIAPVPVIGAGIIQPPGMVDLPIAPVPSVPDAPPTVTRDSFGTGTRVLLSGTGSFSYTLGSDANCLIVGFVVGHNFLFNSNSYTTFDVLCGSTAMTMVDDQSFGAFSTQPHGSTHLFALIDPPTGAQTISWTIVPPSGHISSVLACPSSYVNVGAIENVTSDEEHSHTVNLTVLSEVDGIPVFCGGFINNPSGFNGNNLYQAGGSDDSGSRFIIYGDAPTGNISFNFTTTDYNNYGVCGLNLKKA